VDVRVATGLLGLRRGRKPEAGRKSMPLSIRHYIFEDSGPIKRVPRRIVDSLIFGLDAIPAYAGTR
jgi:hypothetical protein